MTKNVKKTRKKPIETITNSSLFALTVAFALMDLISSSQKSILKKVFQKNDKDEYFLIREEYYDQNGVFEKANDFLNKQRIYYYTAEQLKKLQNLKEKGRGAKFYSKAEKLLKEIGFDIENIEDVFEPIFQSMLQDSFHRASEILFWAMFLERFFKMDTVQGVVNFCYTLVRSLDFLSDFKILKPHLLRLGRLWRWQIAWGLALQDEKVKKFWEDKEKVGEAFLT